MPEFGSIPGSPHKTLNPNLLACKLLKTAHRLFAERSRRQNENVFRRPGLWQDSALVELDARSLQRFRRFQRGPEDLILSKSANDFDYHAPVMHLIPKARAPIDFSRSP